jgi:hypothetical protein
VLGRGIFYFVVTDTVLTRNKDHAA